MKSKMAFTKNDLVVVLVCFIFLLANIAAVGQGGRKRALAAVCLSNLHKWGQIFQTYTADNDGFFHARSVGTGYNKLWHLVYKPYYQDPMMRFCPTADNPFVKTGTFGTWDADRFGSWNPEDYPIPGEGDDQTGPRAPSGSYGMNRYIENLKGGIVGTNPAYWRQVVVKGGDKAPVLMDCMYISYWANEDADPPAYEGDYTTPEMHYICINRHTGYINTVFLDFSARKVGLKELWTLQHTRPVDNGFDTCGPWTICGFGGDRNACAAAWDQAAPWMKDFPEY
jgi:hypothetical protein